MTRRLEPYQKKGKASVLKEEDVRRIRDMAAKGSQSTLQMAQFYGVSVETIRRAIRGETWTHLTMKPLLTEDEMNREAEESGQRMLKQIAAEKERLAMGDKMLEELSQDERIFTAEAFKFKGNADTASTAVQDKLRELGLIEEKK